MDVCPGFLEAALALAVLAGFVIVFFAQGEPALARISALSASDVPQAVVVTGQVRWLNGTRMQVCQGVDCVRVVSKVPLEASLAGRSVAVQGRFRDGTLWTEASQVDVLG